MTIELFGRTRRATLCVHQQIELFDPTVINEYLWRYLVCCFLVECFQIPIKFFIIWHCWFQAIKHCLYFQLAFLLFIISCKTFTFNPGLIFLRCFPPVIGCIMLTLMKTNPQILRSPILMKKIITVIFLWIKYVIFLERLKTMFQNLRRRCSRNWWLKFQRRWSFSFSQK